MKPLPVFSINALSAELGRDRRTITAALRDVPADGVTEGGYDGWTVRTALAALTVRSSGNGEYERARLDKARADLAEFALAKKSAELVPVEELHATWAAIAAGIRKRCSMIPALAAARIDPSRPVAEIERHLREEIDAALTDISTAKIIACDEPTPNQP